MSAAAARILRGELSADEGQRLVTDLSTAVAPMRGLLPDAHALALSTGITVYDATYLTLAVRLETRAITGDDRFARRLTHDPLLAPHVRSRRDFVSA
ncbi:MAG TPA: type II toxin-antitoxin system VapC family toxin [Vicinamibacterales bacterium]|nr:type II toxin-antitoxin system VapC family toxin [Vicinamibacterales bacterium]